MANVQVPRGFGWKTRDDLALLPIFEAKSESCSRFIRSGFVGFGSCEAGESNFGGLETLDVREPP